MPVPHEPPFVLRELPPGPPGLPSVAQTEQGSLIDGAILHTVRQQDLWIDREEELLRSESPMNKCPKPPRVIPLERPRAEPATDTVQRTHQGRRMMTLKALREKNVTKKKSREFWQIEKAKKRAVTVPFELSHLRPTSTVEHAEKVYDHRELAALGIKTVKWDGR